MLRKKEVLSLRQLLQSGDIESHEEKKIIVYYQQTICDDEAPTGEEWKGDVCKSLPRGFQTPVTGEADRMMSWRSCNGLGGDGEAEGERHGSVNGLKAECHI